MDTVREPMTEQVPGICLSVHDVMPSTLADVAPIIRMLEASGIAPAPLLVVPGCAWSTRDIAMLRRWQNAGHELVGHGWTHRAGAIRGFRHRMYSVVLSRGAAEHLALDSGQIAELITRCHAWFEDHDLIAPRRYVPPAWALGSITRTRLRTLPFQTYEVLTGELDARSGRVLHMPLLGFEADTRARARALRAWNRCNRACARLMRAPLRVAIHPKDLSLHLGDELGSLIAELAAGEWRGVRRHRRHGGG